MTKLEEIEQEIKKLEGKEYLTYDICQKLSVLYIVRDHMAGAGTRAMMPVSSPPAQSILK